MAKQVKIQVNATFTVIGSKDYADETKQAVLNAPTGKTRYLLVTLEDDAGQTFTLKMRPRLSKENKSLTCRFTDKAVGEFVTEATGPSKGDVKAQSKAEERKSIENMLLGLDK